MHDEPDDSELEYKLGRAIARFDPVPAEALENAVEGLAWRTIDADLAELIDDSIADYTDAPLVRGIQEPVTFTFQGGGLTIEIEVTRTGRSCRLVGQLVPPQAAVVEIRHRDGRVAVDADDLGRFITESLPPGPLSLRCRTPGTPVVTDWVVI